MRAMTLDDLRNTLVACAGEEEAGDLSGDVLDVTFGDLGYDSLALMETAAKIERDHGIVLPEDAVADADSPRAFLSLVNKLIEAAA